MPSSPKIPKGKILHAALSLLIRDGYGALNIKALAKEIGCSTQPISWHFRNMDGLRNALKEYALSYVNEKMCPKSENGFEAFTETGSAYVNLAFDEPELFKYLYLNRGSEYSIGGLDMIALDIGNQELIESIAAVFGISSDHAALYVTNSVIYSTGILSLVVSGTIKSGRTQVKKMIDNAGYAFLAQAGVDITEAKKLNNCLAEE